jgi:hypothetical protein
MKQRYFGLIVLVAIAFLFAPTANAADRRFAPQRAKPKSKPRMAAPSSRVLTSTEFNSIVSQAFRGAKYSANACGGNYTYRKTTIDISNLYFKEESLARLDYELTKREKTRSERKYPRKLQLDATTRRSKIRACVDNWEFSGWQSGITNGMFKIRMKPNGYNKLILTRAIDQIREPVAQEPLRPMKPNIPFWRDLWNWGDLSARKAIRDYQYRGLSLDILLTPQVDNNGRLSYGEVDVRWHYDKAGFVGPAKFRLIEIMKKIENYGKRNLEIIRGRIRNLFIDNKTRNHLARALTQHVKSGSFSNRTINSVSVPRPKRLGRKLPRPSTELLVSFK